MRIDESTRELMNINFHDVSYPTIADDAFVDVTSWRPNEENNTFYNNINDKRRQIFQSNSFVYIEERIKVSRKVTVSKSEKSLGRNEHPGRAQVTQKDTLIQRKNEDLSMVRQNGYTSEQNDDSITMTTLDDVMATENDFPKMPTRKCSWHLDVERSIGVLRFSEDNLDAMAIGDDNTVFGNEGFVTGHHSWSIKGSGFFCALGVCYPGKENVASSWYKGAKWVWTTDGLQYSEPNGIRRSEFGQWKNEDVLEVHLDCDEGIVSLVNATTNADATLSGFTGMVYPYFNLYKGSSLSLFDTSDE